MIDWMEPGVWGGRVGTKEDGELDTDADMEVEVPQQSSHKLCRGNT